MLRIGIDTGGTFTDFVVLDQDRMEVFKLPSTPAEPQRAVLEGIARVVEGREGYLLQLGSTVATNAFLERKGARCVLLANQGFEDLLEIGRQNRPGLYQLEASRPEPLVPPNLRIGIKERRLWDGSAWVSLESKSLEWLKGKIQQLKPESIAVVLLYSYVNPESEIRIGDALAETGVPISLSHRILPEFREYERTSTTVINAYVQPIMSSYLAALSEEELVRRGRLTVMQSNGGSIGPESARQEPVRTLFSGPAGGVVGAFEVARAAGYERILTLDMGGTSTDVCLCDGRIETTHEAAIDHHPVAIQTIGIHTIGAGGGSIAWVDEAGLLKVGPRSAGADPGPICYGKGDQLTVTDAHLFLGHIDPEGLLGGTMKLAPEKVAPALQDLAVRLGGESGRQWEPHEIAEGILRIVDTQMERALRLISLQRGYDTRDFTLVAFGGAGGLHACALAQALMIPRILVPRHPGALSAMGILRADVIRDTSATLLATTEDPELPGKLEAAAGSLAERVREQLAGQDFESEQVQLEQSLDVRYLGQSYEISVPLSDRWVEDFHSRHEQLYGYSNRALAVEVVSCRVRGRARYPLPELPVFEPGDADPSPEALAGERKVGFGDGAQDCRFFHREQLRAGNRILGPAVILEYSATTLVAKGYAATVDRRLNLLIEPVPAA